MPLPQDKVFLGMTRPSMFGGTHFGAVIVNVIFTMYAFVFTDELWMLAISIPIHGISMLISKYDPFAFRLIGMKLSLMFETIGNVFLWRAASRAPYSKRKF
jgi:type IV secretory pathway VirB3-like protein